METTAQAVSQGQYLTALLLLLLVGCAGLVGAVVYLYRELNRLRHPVVAPDPLPAQKAAQGLVMHPPAADEALERAVRELLARHDELKRAVEEAAATSGRVGELVAEALTRQQQALADVAEALKGLRAYVRDRITAGAERVLAELRQEGRR